MEGREEMGRKGWERVKARFGLEVFGREFGDLLNAEVGEQRNGVRRWLCWEPLSAQCWFQFLEIEKWKFDQSHLLTYL